MAVGALVLFGMIGYRLPGQIRARRAELAAAARGEDPDGADASRRTERRAGREPSGRRSSPAGAPARPGTRQRAPMSEQRILASSAVMAAGTVFSRASGFIRGALLVAALGAGLRGDLFTIANTLPNMVYILLAGGIFNAVLVPQLVRGSRTTPTAATPTPAG